MLGLGLVDDLLSLPLVTYRAAVAAIDSELRETRILRHGMVAGAYLGLPASAICQAPL